MINNQDTKRRKVFSFRLLGANALIVVSFVFSFAVCIGPTLASSERSEYQHAVMGQIDRDFDDGILSYAESIVMKVRAIRSRHSLPDEYRSLALSNFGDITVASRCATSTLIEAWISMESFESSLRTELQSLLARPVRHKQFDSPGGHFKLHYDTSGAQAVPMVDSDFSGIPDFIERNALYADSSWHTQIELFGYFAPPSDESEGGDSRYDIYFDDISFFGYAQPEVIGPAAWDDATSFIILHKDFVGLSTNSDPQGSEIGAAKVTIAHEFQHAVQFAYDFSDEVWFLESSATWMEEMIFDEVNDNYNFFPSFHNAPNTALTKNLAPHYYSTFIWPLYLSHQFDTSLMRSAWEGARYKDVTEVFADSLPSLYGVSRDSAFSEFIVWAYLTGVREDGQHFEEGADYPDMKISDTVGALPVVDQVIGIRPQGYGSSFVRFLPTGSSGTMKISFTGNLNRNWAATVIATRGVSDHDVFTIDLDESGSGALFIPVHEQYAEITMAGINLTAYSVAAEFVYSAEVVSGAAVDGATVSDTIAYTLQENSIGFQITNFGVAIDSFSIFAFDSLGWSISVPTENVILASGADTLVVVSVTPPIGTPKGVENLVTIGAVSATDGSAADSSVALQVVEIFRSDANWDGRFNISDISYMVGWIFRGETGPLPEKISGDATCDSSVNIADITYMVSIIFQGNPFPTCNAAESF